MTTYILILAFPYPGSAIHTQEFSSKTKCVEAGEAFRENTNFSRVICVEK